MKAEPISEKKESLKSQTVSGIGWSMASKFLRQFIQLFFQLVLTRMLEPGDFGYIGMILVFISLADIIRNLGFTQALIQQANISSEQLNSVFWINVFVGILLFGIYQILAPTISKAYSSPQLTSLIRAYSFVFLINSFNSVQEALLHRKIQFKRLFYMDTIAVTIAGIASVIMAYNGMGVWTLVYQYLLISIISAVILWITSDWKPRIYFSYNKIKHLSGFGGNYTFSELLNFVSRNADNFFIGKYLGATPLGFYSRAYFLMLQPVNVTNQVLARVMFPVLSKLQSNEEKFRQVYLEAVQYISIVIFPFIIGIIICSDQIIWLLLGPRWMEVSFLLKVFCIYSMIDTIGLTVNWIYKAKGRTDLMLKFSLYSTVIIITTILIMLPYGIRYIAMGYTASFLTLIWLPGWAIAFRIIDLKLSNVLKMLAPPFLCAVISGGITYILSLYLNHLHPFLFCLSGFILIFTLYFFLISFISKSSFRKLKGFVQFIKKQVKSKNL